VVAVHLAVAVGAALLWLVPAPLGGLYALVAIGAAFANVWSMFPTGITIRPKGARHPRPRLTGETAVEGIVRSETGMAAPLTGRSCVAFDIELINSRCDGASLIARDGATSGFCVETDDGRRIDIPRGHVFITGQRTWGDRTKTRRYAKSLDSTSVGHDATLFPFEDARESIVRIGDRVALHTDIVFARESRTSDPYREISNRVYVPVGTPHIQSVE
jgi:hypothetical protein